MPRFISLSLNFLPIKRILQSKKVEKPGINKWNNILAIKNKSVSSPWLNVNPKCLRLEPSHTSPNTGRDHRLTGGRHLRVLLPRPEMPLSPLRFSQGQSSVLLAPSQLLIHPTHAVWMVNPVLATFPEVLQYLPRHCAQPIQPKPQEGSTHTNEAPQMLTFQNFSLFKEAQKTQCVASNSQIDVLCKHPMKRRCAVWKESQSSELEPGCGP